MIAGANMAGICEKTSLNGLKSGHNQLYCCLYLIHNSELGNLCRIEKPRYSRLYYMHNCPVLPPVKTGGYKIIDALSSFFSLFNA